LASRAGRRPPGTGPARRRQFLLIDSAGKPALLIELTEVAVVPISVVGEGFAHAEGRSVAAGRGPHLHIPN
jgi:uncharacterized protein YhfF